MSRNRPPRFGASSESGSEPPVLRPGAGVTVVVFSGGAAVLLSDVCADTTVAPNRNPLIPKATHSGCFLSLIIRRRQLPPGSHRPEIQGRGCIEHPWMHGG